MKKAKAGEIGEVIYCEGEYIHDCSNCWADITYGYPDHWRNKLHSNFYCTHSLGPIITITGLRPVSIVGFETPLNMEEKQMKIGFVRTSGIEMVTLENGAVVKSIHGAMKIEPWQTNFKVYGIKGMMQSGGFMATDFSMYKEEREEYKNDNIYTNPKIASGNDLLPCSTHKEPKFGPEVYEYMKNRWLGNQK